MSFFWIIGLAFLTLITGLIGSGTNDIAKMAAIVFFPSALALYFSPAIVASLREHHNRVSIGILNLFLGWTLLGWVGALIWAYGAKRQAIPDYGYTPPTTSHSRDSDDEKACPFCAEMIKSAARKCKHCGSNL